jgi:peptide/nickel transport system substrate-binding protein
VDVNDGLDRRDLLRYGVQGAGLLAGGSLLAACGGSTGASSAAGTSTTGTSTGPSSSGTPIKGGTLRLGMLSQGSSETVNPQVAIVQPDYARIFALYDPLFVPVPGGSAPGLATWAEASRDAKTWTLRLRKGVEWHDGKPFTADDVVYTIKSWGTKESALQGQATALIDLKNVRRLDAYTVQVPLLRAFAALPAFTTWITAVVIQDGTTDFRHPIGTGPFKFGSFTPGSQSNFPANPNYWRGAPHIDALVINSSFTDDAARANALVSRQIDIAPGMPFALAKANSASRQIVLGNVPSPSFNTVVMRVDVPPFNDPRVTQAVKLAVDREAIVRDVYDGYAIAANDLVGFTWKYFASDIKTEYDPEKARSLLKAAGQENLSVPMYSAETLPGQNELATIVSGQLKKIGVNAPLKLLPVATYFTSASPGYLSDQRNFFSTYWNNFAPALGWFYENALSPGGQFNETGWGHKAAQNTLINDAIGEVDPARAEAKWRAVQEQQIQEGGYLIPAWFNYVDGYAPNVRGVASNSAGPCANYDFHAAWLSQ